MTKIRGLLGYAMLIITISFFTPSAYGKDKNRFDFTGYNVVLVCFDALQASHTSALGYFRKTTPTIDEFAASGFLFKQAISQASWTVPSMMSMLTSMYPSEHRVINKYSIYNDNGKVFSDLKKLSPSAETLAEALKDNGYVTGGFTGDAGVSARFGFGKGFDIYLDDQKFGGFDHSVPPAISWLRQNKNRKFFMFLHGYDSHGQYDPAGGFTRRFVDFDYKGHLKGGKEEQARLREEGLEKGSLQLTDADARFWKALYDEKINDADRRFALFVDEMKRLGLLDKTIVVIVSDHGTEFYEHKRFDHGFTLYDELIHVPLVIYLPGLKGNKVIEEQVRSIDIMPTVLDLLRIKVNAGLKNQMRGRSLVPILQGEKDKRVAFSETDYRLYTHKRSLRTPDGWKFIYTLENNKKGLYNLNNDPAEQVNLVDREPKKAYLLEQELFAWLDSMQTDPGSYSNKKEQMIKEY